MPGPVWRSSTASTPTTRRRTWIDNGPETGAGITLVESQPGRPDLSEFLGMLAAFLWPEHYPAGDPLHDPDHPFWDNGEPTDDCYQWNADTIEVVADFVERELKRVRRAGS